MLYVDFTPSIFPRIDKNPQSSDNYRVCTMYFIVEDKIAAIVNVRSYLFRFNLLDIFDDITKKFWQNCCDTFGICMIFCLKIKS